MQATTVSRSFGRSPRPRLHLIRNARAIQLAGVDRTA